MGFAAGLGSFAGGMAQGLERGQLMSLQEQRAGLADAAEQRLRRADERQAKLDVLQEQYIADNEAARKAGADVIAKAQKDYTAQWAKQQPGPTMDSGIVQPAPMPDFQPDERTVLKAAKAHYDELFKRGRTDEAVKAWSLTEAKRMQMRGTAAQNVMAALQMGGDVKGALSAFDDTIDNGHTVKSVEQRQGPDGKPVYVITRQDDAGNETPPMTMSAQQLASTVQQLTMDPKQAATAALQEKLIVARHLAALDEIKARDEGRNARDEANRDSRERIAKLKLDGGITVAQIRKSGGGGSGGGDTGARVQSTIPQADGTRIVLFRDGTRKLLLDEKGNPAIGLDFEKLVGATAGQVGQTVEGSMATPEANRARARQMLPQAPKAGLSDAKGAKDYSKLWAD